MSQTNIPSFAQRRIRVEQSGEELFAIIVYAYHPHASHVLTACIRRYAILCSITATNLACEVGKMTSRSAHALVNNFPSKLPYFMF